MSPIPAGRPAKLRADASIGELMANASAHGSITSTPIHSLLVTDGAGFIGSNFVRFVLAQRPR